MLEHYRERNAEVATTLGALTSLAEKLGAHTLRDRIAKDLVAKLAEDRFHLVVVGEFNHGKSTFVNALIGEKVLRTGVTPTTAAIHHLKYADAPEATLVTTSGERRPLAFPDVGSFAVGGSSVVDAVDYLEIGYPAPLLREQILLVDTPGVNDLSLQRSDITYSYIPRADAVLFLLDAGQILKESERVFLTEKLLRASRDKIVFVVTKWDILDADEAEQALAYAKKQLALLVHDPVIFPVSAEAALSGGAGAASSGMGPLLEHLTTFLADQRGRILLDNALLEGLNVAMLLERGVDAHRRALAMQTEEIERRIAALERDLAGQAGTIEQRRSAVREDVVGIKVGVRKDLERFVDDTIAKLPAALDGAKASELKTFLPAFLEDVVRRWAEDESREVAEQLEQLAEKTVALVREDAHDASKRITQTLGGESARLDVRVDTLRYDAGVAALLAVGVGMLFVNVAVGGVLTIAAPVLALVFKDRIDAEYKKAALEAAPDVLRQAARDLGPKLDAMIDEFAASLDAWVVTAGEELHREVLEVLRATKETRAAGATDEVAARAAIEALAADLTLAVGAIERERASLSVQSAPAHGAPQAGAEPAPATL